MDNPTLALKLERLASLLQAQQASPYRIDAWRAAAAQARTAAVSLDAVATNEGVEGLKRALQVGDGIGSAVRELLATGRLRMLDRLEGEVSPDDLFISVPGVGPTLAGHVHAKLGLETLEELELAAADGRLAQVAGFGPRRIALVREAVAGMLEHSMRRRYRRAVPSLAPHEAPSVDTLLRVDALYRSRAEANELPRIAPVHFNPRHEAWLPVLHTEADGFTFTALYSNTSRAHRLGTTRDWVVVYFERDGHESQCTIVTETRGSRVGQRVVRGREREGRAAPAA